VQTYSGPATRPGQAGASIPVRPYSAIPHELIEDRRLIGTDIRLVGVLLKYCKGKDRCYPSVARLARDLGCCERTIQYALRRLRRAGWVEARPDDGNPTGRVLVMTWRGVQSAAGPRVQAPYTQGMPRVAPEGFQRKREEKGSAPAPEIKTPGPEPKPREAPDRPLSPGDVLAHYTEAGWLALPVGHPLRRIAEAAVERALGGSRDDVTGPSGPGPGVNGLRPEGRGRPAAALGGEEAADPAAIPPRPGRRR
jgi:Helix-turn-helix domain